MSDVAPQLAPAPLSPRQVAELAWEIPDSVLLINSAAQVLWANSMAERLFGLTFDEFGSKSGLDLVHPDDLEIVALSLGTVQTKDVGLPLEVRMQAHDGWRLVELIGAPSGDNIVVSLRDLTERRRWEIANDGDARFRTLMQNSSMLTILVDAAGIVQSSSSALSRLLGHDQEWLENRAFDEIVAPSDRTTWRSALAKTVGDSTTGAESGLDLTLTKLDGTTVPFAVRVKNLLDDATVDGLVISGHDITDRVAAEASVRSANSVLAATLESTAEGILVVDVAGRIASYNQRYAEMWRLPASILRAGDDEAVIAHVLPQVCDPDAFANRVIEIYNDIEAESSDLLECLDGRLFERNSLPQSIDGEVVGRVWSFRDVTEDRELRKELTHQAFHDALTGLANQALFRQRVDEALSIAENAGTSVAVLFVDLDDFKTVNDSLGHLAGDELLVAMSERLLTCLRKNDFAARLGGDEFAVLIEDIGDEAHAIAIAERVVAALREPIMIEARSMVVSASVGIAFAEVAKAVNGGALLRNADLAMYEAKSQGKGRFCVFAPDMHDAAVERFEVLAHLRGAAARDELVVHYQPIYTSESLKVRAVEALVRWQHPERGLLGPGSFIPLAETSGLIDEIGDHVLRESLRQVGRWQEELGDDVPAINVNLSPRQLLDASLPESSRRPSTGQRRRPRSAGSRDHRDGTHCSTQTGAATNLQRLRQLGVRLAVDDFGTGYSSLNYLERFPIDFLKIDGSFVNNMLARPESSMVLAVIQLAHTLGLEPIAEGVETEAQARALHALGLRHVAGLLPRQATDDRRGT